MVKQLVLAECVCARDVTCATAFWYATADSVPEELYPKIKSIVTFRDSMVKLGSRAG